MHFRAFSIPLFFLLFGTIWALVSDPIIHYFDNKDVTDFYFTSEIGNDLTFVFGAAFLLFLQIRKKRKTFLLSEAQYRSLFMVNPNSMVIYSVDNFQFIEVNNAAILKYGYSRKEFLGMTIKDIRSAVDYEKLDDDIKKGTADLPECGLREHVLKSGERIIVSLQFNRLDFNNQLCIMAMVTDVTAVVNSKEKLKEALLNEQQLNYALEENIHLVNKAHVESRRMGEVIDKLSNLVVLFDENSYITWVNMAFLEFTEYSMEEIVGEKTVESLIGPNTDQKIFNAMRSAIAQRIPFSCELINYKKNGEEYWTQISISPIFDDAGKFEFYISVESVITQQKENEKKLNLQNRAFREIAWANSHEARRPLCSILSLIELLKESKNEDERNEVLVLLEKSSLDLDITIKKNVRKINELECSVGTFSAPINNHP
ncbi:Sensory box histidine kinase [Arcticibacter svalbardensis MN12-7]|uniref:Sensory box histidine kinase n=1 Tax=Arcticibacter svalbardensis MN12-7 TaxID=1150600 RepID=R9H0E3_9SPHI|nr:PAS domain S-box protein [Arcticibacter svalbardensis]EOR94669.1 Sensory box histidine kinase [Arcticibacter svalbardensis MN12-7]